MLSRSRALWCLVDVTGPDSEVDRAHARVVEAYGAVSRFAGVVADSDVDPADLVHEALVRMLSRGSLDEIADVGAYLRRAVLNGAANHRRSQGRRRWAIERLKARQVDESAASEMPSDLGDLMRLEPIDRGIVFLFVVEGRPHRQVELSEGAVRARLSRALKRLRVELHEEGVRGDTR